MKNIKYYILLWFPLMGVAILNGAARQIMYGPFLPDLYAHQISTISLIILLALYTWAADHFIHLSSKKSAAFIGFLWLVMTISFEFIFGHYIMKHSWEHLLHDYNIFEGRIWLCVLAAILILPSIIYRIRTGQADKIV